MSNCTHTASFHCPVVAQDLKSPVPNCYIRHDTVNTEFSRAVYSVPNQSQINKYIKFVKFKKLEKVIIY